MDYEYKTALLNSREGAIIRDQYGVQAANKVAEFLDAGAQQFQQAAYDSGRDDDATIAALMETLSDVIAKSDEVSDGTD